MTFMNPFLHFKQKVSFFWKDALIKKIGIAYVSLFVLFFMLFIWKGNQLPPQIPLFYSLPRSNDQLGTPVLLMGIPLLSFFFFCLNFIVSVILYQKEKVASVLLFLSGVIVVFLAFITTLKIFFLVT